MHGVTCRPRKLEHDPFSLGVQSRMFQSLSKTEIKDCLAIFLHLLRVCISFGVLLLYCLGPCLCFTFFLCHFVFKHNIVT